ncbi:MAG: hypothetical protein HY854_14620 [Burkholderiales bacterium]|nr:hypothetical protein [Burkholderiales bacterium]
MQAARRHLSILLEAITMACGVTFGRQALDSVELPSRLQYQPHARTQRLVHGAQLSAW